MKGFWLRVLGGGAACWLGLTPAVEGLASLDPTLLWPQGPAAGALFFGLGALWVLGWAAFGAMGFALPWMRGAQAALGSSAFFLLGLLWAVVPRLPLPPPHDFAARKLQIFLAGLFLAALATALTRLLLGLGHTGAWQRYSPRQLSLRLGALAWVVYLLSGLWTWRWQMTGDAPIYLLLSSGLVEHQTLDLVPSFEAKDWKRFYDLDKELLPQDEPQASGTRFVEHRPLTAFVMAPFYALAGFAGALWIQTLLAACAAALFHQLLRVRGFMGHHALLGFALFAFGAPWWSYSINLHMDLLGGVFAWGWFCAWMGVLPPLATWTLPAVIAWTALRFNPSAGLFALADALRQRTQWRRALLSLAIFAAALGAYAWMSQLQFGSASPTAQYENRDYTIWQILDPANALWHFFGVFLDQEYGLLTYTYPLILAFAGLGALWARRDETLWPLAVWLLPYGALICGTKWWWGGQNPNRYMIFVAPALTYLAVEGWRALRFKGWTLWLAAAGWLGALLLQVLPWFTYTKKDGAAWPLKIAGKALHRDIVSYFPSFLVENAAATYWSMALTVLALWLFYRGARAPRP